jgi:glutaredoxin
MSLISQILSKHDTVIISKNNCPFCDEAKKLFEKKHINPFVISMEESPKEYF